MRNVTWFMCLLATIVFAIAEVASAQQQPIDDGSPLDQSNLQAQEVQQPVDASELPPHQGQQPAARQPQDRSLLRNDQPPTGQASAAVQNEPSPEAQPRGELGVWLAAIDGPGLAIRRITTASAAEQAGLRAGDVLMQVNDRWATSPREVAEMIRAIPIGETVKLQIWRDGQIQDLSAAIAPARPQAIAMSPMNSTPQMNPDQEYQVGFRGEAASTGGDLSQRVMQLEKQLGMMTQEMQQLREQMTQMRSSSAAPAGIETNVAPPQQSAPPASEQPAPPATEQPSAETSQPKADEAPATEKPAEDDSLFK